MNFWNAAFNLPTGPLIFLAVALFVAFIFEFINGFHDTANAVTAVIYTRSLRPTPAVVFSGVMNFLGALINVLFLGAGVAFTIVNLLPVDLLVDARSNAALVMVVSLLLAGVLWNLGTWYMGLPVSSSHTLIGCILGVGIANGLWNKVGFEGVEWSAAVKVGIGLLVSPLIGFLFAGGLLLLMRLVLRQPRLYQSPQGEDKPPMWIRLMLIGTCGGVSFFHGSNDGQKGMGLLLLVLIGFLPAHYALTVNDPEMAPKVLEGVREVRQLYAKHEYPVPEQLSKDLDFLERELAGKASFEELPHGQDERWKIRQAIYRIVDLKKLKNDKSMPAELKEDLKKVRSNRLADSIEYIPIWVVFCTALALGIGTMIGYKRIVVTVAEKIGKTHLTYAQGAAAGAVTAGTILVADLTSLPVSTTQVLSSSVAGTMVANRSGVQSGTCEKILLAWVLTLPVCMLLGGSLFALGRLFVG
ncbi:MAG TPA: inorganic phosphate transporter [Gemmata sp.]|jgi:phosphate/sulfate permease|nr:inorganic phosphate transporter [Gemmata sp.]